MIRCTEVLHQGSPTRRLQRADRFLRSLGEFCEYGFFIGEASLNARSLFKTGKVFLTICEPGQIEFELFATTEAPEEMCVRCGKLIKEVLATSEPIVANLIIFVKLRGGEPSHALVGTRYVANARRR